MEMYWELDAFLCLCAAVGVAVVFGVSIFVADKIRSKVEK